MIKDKLHLFVPKVRQEMPLVLFFFFFLISQPFCVLPCTHCSSIPLFPDFPREITMPALEDYRSLSAIDDAMCNIIIYKIEYFGNNARVHRSVQPKNYTYIHRVSYLYSLLHICVYNIIYISLYGPM